VEAEGRKPSGESILLNRRSKPDKPDARPMALWQAEERIASNIQEIVDD